MRNFCPDYQPCTYRMHFDRAGLAMICVQLPRHGLGGGGTGLVVTVYNMLCSATGDSKYG